MVQGGRMMEKEKIVKAIGSEFIHQCPTCKSVLPKDSSLKYCPYCGQKISDGYKFIDLTDIGI